jgi:uncharacterized protein YbaA (DUF1428 family)
MSYIEFYILPVVAARIDDYRKIAVESAALWLQHGALSVVESVADDAPMGTLTSFPRSVQLLEDEVVICAYITYRDRAHRDDVQARVMADATMERLFQDAPVDGKRMIWGGFKTIVDTEAA